MEKFEYLEHPGDIKLRSFGDSLPELFVNTALGMMNFLYGKQKITLTHFEEITIESRDLESLLVEWLSEILWLSDTYHRAYTHYEIVEFNENKISAKVRSGPAEAREDIKAVTYNELDISKIDEQWTATVVYDI